MTFWVGWSKTMVRQALRTTSLAAAVWPVARRALPSISAPRALKGSAPPNQATTWAGERPD